jgi:hypothetical protein
MNEQNIRRKLGLSKILIEDRLTFLLEPNAQYPDELRLLRGEILRKCKAMDQYGHFVQGDFFLNLLLYLATILASLL